MTMLISGAFALLLIGAGIAQFLLPRPFDSAPPSPVESSATTTMPIEAGPSTRDEGISTTPLSADPPSFSLAQGDEIVSWNFKGAYTGNTELEAKARAEIERLSAILATATSSAMITAIGIASQYELLGDGKQQYEYLGRAIKEDVNITSSLPWHNLGVLMERLGAYETASIAYKKATLVQPGLKQWHYAYIEFLTTRMKDNVADIEKAFVAAIANLGQSADMLQLRSEWEQS